MQEKFFFGNPVAQFQTYKSEILAAMARVCEAGPYILGAEVAEFEKEFSQFCEVKHTVGVASGTDALILAMRAYDIGAGDEVITVSHTAVATASAIVGVGAIPVLVDIDPVFYTMDIKKIESSISEKTKAIIAVHIYGQPCDMDAILEIAKRHKLIVIEDCAQSHGAKYKGKRVGSMGHVGCFSFYPTKNLGAIGDGGAVVTNDDATKSKLMALRQYGWDSNRFSQMTSGVSRLDEIQAAILRIKLKFLDRDNGKRNEVALKYRELKNLKDLLHPAIRENSTHSFHLYVIQVPQRNKLKDELASVAIEAGIHYEYAVHQHPAFEKIVRISPEGLKVTEKMVKTILSLPIYPELADGKVDVILNRLNDIKIINS
jgi:dTDP-4-amino-4,6-dideoxygalactose transaminase